MLLYQACQRTGVSRRPTMQFVKRAKICIACSGYRVTARAGHHAVTFEGANLAIGAKILSLTDYFDACRRKRNLIDYDNSSVASETEAEELLKKAYEFHALVEKWFAVNHAIWKADR